MKALDTNVLVRLLTGDDPGQAEQAAEVLRAGPTFVSRTVILETEWVLRFTYGFGREAIAGAFTRLLGLPSLQVEDAVLVTRAIRWHRAGMDFADALHLAASAPEVDELVTFDRAFARVASEACAVPRVRALEPS